jgi:hypothetical protein
VQTFEECLLMYRQRLRELLYQHGVASNPGVEDTWILDQVEELVGKTRLPPTKGGKQPLTEEGFQNLLALPLLPIDRRFVQLHRERNNQPTFPPEWRSAGFGVHGRMASINRTCKQCGCAIRFLKVLGHRSQLYATKPHRFFTL